MRILLQNRFRVLASGCCTTARNPCHSYTPFCPAAIERHVRDPRSHCADERRAHERRGRAWHGVHASSPGPAGVHHADVGILRGIRGRAGLPRVGRDDPGLRGERDTRESGVRQPRHRQGHRLPGNAVQDRRQRGLRQPGLRGGESALREAAARPDLHEREG